MPRRSAEARTSAAWAASSLRIPKCRKMRVLNSRRASIGKTLASTAGMNSLSLRRDFCANVSARIERRDRILRWHFLLRAKTIGQAFDGVKRRSERSGKVVRRARGKLRLYLCSCLAFFDAGTLYSRDEESDSRHTLLRLFPSVCPDTGSLRARSAPEGTASQWQIAW